MERAGMIEAKELGQRCGCGGEIDKLYRLEPELSIWAGRCFVCGKVYTVIDIGQQKDKMIEC